MQAAPIAPLVQVPPPAIGMVGTNYPHSRKSRPIGVTPAQPSGGFAMAVLKPKRWIPKLLQGKNGIVAVTVILTPRCRCLNVAQGNGSVRHTVRQLI